jgi:hypothetical protein
MPRLWIADQHSVRLSLPWHGPASWDDMHAYVAKVIDENTIPTPDYVPRREAQATRLARGILLSVCHRLNIEPVGAFDFHDPEGAEEQEPAVRRCVSCEHELGFHSDDGCWYTITRGRVNINSVCPCRVSAEEIGEGLIND